MWKIKRGEVEVEIEKEMAASTEKKTVIRIIKQEGANMKNGERKEQKRKIQKEKKRKQKKEEVRKVKGKSETEKKSKLRKRDREREAGEWS